MIHLLNIYFNTQLIGNLQFDDESEKFDLQYDEKWMEKGFPISPVLDFEKNYSSKDVKTRISYLKEHFELAKSIKKSDI